MDRAFTMIVMIKYILERDLFKVLKYLVNRARVRIEMFYHLESPKERDTLFNSYSPQRILKYITRKRKVITFNLGWIIFL